MLVHKTKVEESFLDCCTEFTFFVLIVIVLSSENKNLSECRVHKHFTVEPLYILSLNM